MKIDFCYGYGGSPDGLKNISFCCDKMREEIISHNEVKITNTGNVVLGGRKKINFCPHCGLKIDYNGITTEDYKRFEREFKNPLENQNDI